MTTAPVPAEGEKQDEMKRAVFSPLFVIGSQRLMSALSPVYILDHHHVPGRNHGMRAVGIR